MNESKLAGNQLLVGGRPFYVRGGEIQYFRLPFDQWRDRLQKARDGGLNTVSSYMPWYFHEPREGTFDFSGDSYPERDLRRFLDEAAALDFKVIARPGPFINSELRCGGIPEWLFRRYPETMSRNSTGQIAPGRPLPAEGESVYRRLVRRWYQHVNTLLAPYDASRGGPMILFQPDNELSAAWSFGLLNSLYDPTILGQTWPAWLQRTYGSPAALSDRYGHRVSGFSEVEPPRAFPQTPAEKYLCLDWMNFKRWFFADWGATLAGWAREDGIQIPVVFNEPVAGFYEHGDHAGFGQVLKSRGLIGMTACHTYSQPLIDLEGAVAVALPIGLTKSSPWNGPPMSVEVNTNWFMPRLNRTPINWGPLLRLGLAHGLKGSLIYPFAAGTVDLKDVIEGPEYFDPSCLDRSGQPAEGFEDYRRLNRFIRGWEKELLASELPEDLTVAYSPASRLLDFLGAPALLKAASPGTGPGGDSFKAEPGLDRSAASPGHDWLDGYESVSKQTVPAEAGVWKKLREALLLLTRLNRSFNLLDLVNPNRLPGRGWLIVPCTGSLERLAIEYLLAHLDAGGGCLFFPTIPVFDLDGRSDRRLADRLGVRLVDQVRPAGGEPIDYGARVITLGAGDRVGVHGWLFIHDLPGQSQILAEYQGRPLIARLPADRGRVLLAGLDLAFTTAGSLRLWETVLGPMTSAAPGVTVTGNYIHALLRQVDATGILTVANLTGRTGPSTVRLFSLIDLAVDLELAPHEARCLVINIPLGGTRLLYATSELIPVDGSRKAFELHGRPGTPGELAFAAPVKGHLDGAPTASKTEGNRQVIRYRHGFKPLVFSLQEADLSGLGA